MTKKTRLQILIGVPVLLIVALAIGFGLGAAKLASAGPAPQATPVPTTDQAWIGVTLVDLNSKVAKQLNLKRESGVAILNVVADSPAEKAGLKRGDVLLKVNDTAVATSKEAVKAVQAAKSGDTLTLTVVRGDAEQAVKVTAGTAPTPTTKQLGGRHSFDFKFDFGWPNGMGQGDQQNLTPLERFQRFLGQTFKYRDQDNTVVTVTTIPGTITNVSATSLTITPNDNTASGGPFAINSNTKIWAGPGKTSASDLQAGDQVVVITNDGRTALTITKSIVEVGPFFRAPTSPGRVNPREFPFRGPGGTSSVPVPAPKTSD
jgi:membrane-associated protease RseP (regulator of RpoE activity)